MKIAPKPLQRTNHPTHKASTEGHKSRGKTPERLHRLDRHSDAFETRRGPHHGSHVVPVSYKGPIIRTGTSNC